MRIILTAVATLAGLGLVASMSCAADARLKTVIEVAEEPQDFYPIGSTILDGIPTEFYVMSGMTAAPISGNKARGAALINLHQPNGNTFQLVEIMSLDCNSGSVMPTFRMAFTEKGLVDGSNGPVEPNSDVSPTILTPAAAIKISYIVCSGAVPEDKLVRKTLADFRKP